MKIRPTLINLCGALFLGSALFADASDFIDNLNAGKPQTIVFYGTSETQGGRWADTIATRGGLADWLTAKYGKLATAINSGMSGRASNTGVANLKARVLDKHPDAVIIEFSMNDAFTAYKPNDPDLNISVEKSTANINTMIDEILKENPKAEVILQTMNPVFDVGNGAAATHRPNLAAYYQAYRDVAAKRGLLLIDNHAKWEALKESKPDLYKSYLPDGLHPNQTGSLAVTLPTIEQALTEPRKRK